MGEVQTRVHVEVLQTASAAGYREGILVHLGGSVAFSYGGVVADGMWEVYGASMEKGHLEICQGVEEGTDHYREVYQDDVE